MYIYLTTNLINNKKYIGQSIKEPIDNQNYFGSGVNILKAIKKYGIKNFTKEILKDNINNKMDLNYWEIFYINIFNAYKSNEFYNASIGGNYNISWSEFSKEEKNILCTKISDGVKKYLNNRSEEDKIKHSNNCKKSLLEITNKIKLNSFKFYNSIEFTEFTYDIIRLEIKKRKKHFIEWINYSLNENDIKQFYSDYNKIKHKKLSNNSGVKKEIFQFDKNGILIRKYKSLEEAVIELNLKSKGNLTSTAKGLRNYCNGFRWSYNEKPNLLLPKKITGRKSGVKDSKKRIKTHTNKITIEILQYDLNMNLLNIFSSGKDAIEKLEHLNLKPSKLNHAINNRVDTYKGFIWKKGNKIKTTIYNENKKNTI